LSGKQREVGRWKPEEETITIFYFQLPFFNVSLAEVETSLF
jgi:hypothetical protein